MSMNKGYLLEGVKVGFNRGLITTFNLAKIVVPVFFVVTILKATPVMYYLDVSFSPFMKYFGLPGEASLVLITGYLLNIYSAVGVIMGLNLNPREITILATMVLIAHSLILEGVICSRIGVNPFFITIFRISTSFIVGFCLNVMLR
ncbi:nucleoside recognition domain protein [Thermodesulfobium narugense DSM 14796]|uniref:Nucleoside recognition domain protein n=1 Tax=Thermodesulfobium narugense DSM 14796 TaxID=747365 RepID=M1E9F3_9BACT|nr:nucleoside recognition domain-containing protein [Thermodesulfobium narugense]AEE15179.1 nucleoside recognition domain protein [Thermodesulfobium narugense DSM 14796]